MMFLRPKPFKGRAAKLFTPAHGDTPNTIPLATRKAR